jgi:RNA exonuclease 1
MDDYWDDEEEGDDFEFRAFHLKHPIQTVPRDPQVDWGSDYETWIQKYMKTIEQERPEMSAEDMYASLKTKVLSIDEMIKLGFPIPRNDWSVGLGTCDRCEKRITVYPSGKQVNTDECRYHKGFFLRHSRAGNRMYSCCPIANPGCVKETSHLITQELELPPGFSKTSRTDKKVPGIYAIDCEMCDINLGGGVMAKEVVQLAVVDCITSSVVYKEIIRPEDPIHNCNTFVHGLARQQIETAKISASECRKFFLELVSSESILIGHDIKSDLRALKVVHYNIIETQHAFPHPLGGHNKTSLRNLLKDRLNLEIDSQLHDPADDAFACMFLVHTLL